MADPGFVAVARWEDLPARGMLHVEVDDHPVLVVRVDDDVFALDAVCTHAWAQLEEGTLDGHEIQCPLHRGRFDVRTGGVMRSPPREPLRTYPVVVEGGDVLVKVA